MQQYRDLSIMPIAGDQQLAIACDTSASIGRKTSDQVQTSPAVTAAFCVRVVLMELLSIGAQPQLLVNLFSNEMEPTGEQMLKGIREELERANLSDLPMNGSTEENMTTAMTSLGITGIGQLSKSSRWMHQVQAGDCIYQIGQPYMGDALLAHLDDVYTYADIAYLQAHASGLHEIVPIGSKGALVEIKQLMQLYNLNYELSTEVNHEWLSVSAGPATSMLVIGQPAIHSAITDHFSQWQLVGRVDA